MQRSRIISRDSTEAGRQRSIRGFPSLYSIADQLLKSETVSCLAFVLPFFAGFGGEIIPDRSLQLTRILQRVGHTFAATGFPLSLSSIFAIGVWWSWVNSTIHFSGIARW